MTGKIKLFGLIVLLSASLSTYADDDRNTRAPSNTPLSEMQRGTTETGAKFKLASQVESAADKLYSNSFEKFNRFGAAHDTDTQSCDMDDTALITIYSANSMAQAKIEVKIDGSPVGSLTTFFPDEGPGCKTPSGDGVITLMVPAGKHVLEADSHNLIWPRHTFSVEKCGCLLLPLS